MNVAFRTASTHIQATLRTSFVGFRAMSTAPARQRFFIYAPDKTDEGTLDNRLSVRASHLETAKERIANGFIRVAGAVTTPESMLEDKKHMIGSVFICEAESIDEVKKLMQSDIYFTSGVWDPEKMIILPFFAATTIP